MSNGSVCQCVRVVTTPCLVCLPMVQDGRHSAPGAWIGPSTAPAQPQSLAAAQTDSCLAPDLVERIAGVGDELTQEDLLVAAEGSKRAIRAQVSGGESTPAAQAWAGRGGAPCTCEHMPGQTAGAATAACDGQLDSRVEGVDDQRQQLVDVALDCKASRGRVRAGRAEVRARQPSTSLSSGC